jgi:competence protein ComEC
MLALADRLHVEIRIPRPGEELIRGGEAEIVQLGIAGGSERSGSNDQSLVLRFAHNNLSCLFAGDISSNIESQLVENDIPLQSSLLLSPHHGSSTSNSELFLKAVNPKTIVVSAGRFRPANFPAPEVRKRCNELGIKMLITAEQGAISFSGKKDVFPQSF